MAKKKLYKSFEIRGKVWLKALDRYNDEPFTNKPSEKEWSVGQLYNHLSLDTIEYHIKNIENCIQQQNGQLGGKKKFKGKITFMTQKLGRAKGKNKGIDERPTPPQPKDTEDARNNMIKLMKAMNTYGDIALKADTNYKIQHPVFGFLNAIEWYWIAIWHFDYHTKQKIKLDKRLMK